MVELPFKVKELDGTELIKNVNYDFGIGLPKGRKDVPNLNYCELTDSVTSLSLCHRALTCKIPESVWVVATEAVNGDKITAIAVVALRIQGFSINNTMVSDIGRLFRDKSVEWELTYDNLAKAVLFQAKDKSISLLEKVSFIYSCLLGDVDGNKISQLVAQHADEERIAINQLRNS